MDLWLGKVEDAGMRRRAHLQTQQEKRQQGCLIVLVAAVLAVVICKSRKASSFPSSPLQRDPSTLLLFPYLRTYYSLCTAPHTTQTQAAEASVVAAAAASLAASITTAGASASPPSQQGRNPSGRASTARIPAQPQPRAGRRDLNHQCAFPSLFSSIRLSPCVAKPTT